MYRTKFGGVGGNRRAFRPPATWPATCELWEGPAPRPPRTRGFLSAKPHVLLIDDDASILSAVRRLLVRSGHDVTEAPNGAEGLRLWREQGAGLVLTDLQMPGMNGLEVILQLRAYAPTLPVIAMSGGERSRDLDLLGTAGLLGAVGLLTKPFTADELAAAVGAAAGQAGQRPA